MLEELECSPHTRGWFAGTRTGLIDLHVLPAYAGLVPGPGVRGSLTAYVGTLGQLKRQAAAHVSLNAKAWGVV